jgi:cation diffusion facilitator family transporter
LEKEFKRALRLEYFTVGYNILEALTSVLFGIIAASIALIGFGLDSIIESVSGLILIWRLTRHNKVSEEQEQKIEKKAIKFVAITFFIIAIYILYESAEKLLTDEIPQPSLGGIIISILSLIVMPILAIKKRRLGEKINSKALIADSKETLICSFLSAALLIGLGSNYLFNFWQADPIVALIIVIYLLKEGWENWKESSEPIEKE